ncbi:MAG: M24 family metallopeptidase C-terminal domain-containing protein [Ignavibacteriales bacterium]|nr:M24 family metallopeptidase C-terminal domain-containing protein [Ignavibacteriales bacterium]
MKPCQEFPQREASKITLESGMFFSIEPGLYNDNWGGVRLENVVCVINTETGKRLQTMTKCRFDENLIDYNILDEQEIQWLRDYQKKATG